MSHNAFDMHFHDLVRSKRFDEARVNLDQRETAGGISKAAAARQTAYIFRAEGKVEQAVATVSAAIQEGSDQNHVCQAYRGELYLEQGKLSNAAQDFAAVLSGRNSITQRFHSFVAFRIAWIKALEGDPSYRTYLDRFPNETEGFIIDRIVKRSDIEAIFMRRKNGGERSSS